MEYVKLGSITMNDVAAEFAVHLTPQTGLGVTARSNPNSASALAPVAVSEFSL